MGGRKSIRNIIHQEYIKTALIPILLIELILLMMYFVITGYVGQQMKRAVLLEARNHIEELSTREVKDINSQMVEIKDLAVILQKNGQRIFEEPGFFGTPDEMPQFATADNGVLYKSNNNGGASVWYSALTPIGADQLDKAARTEAMDPLFRTVHETSDNIMAVYFNSNDSMCRYYPYLERVYDVFDPDMNIPEFSFYYLADEKHNPNKGPVWTEVYLDPARQGWMASCVVPIYKQGHLEGVTGIDITIDSIVQNILDLKLPWDASGFLVDKEGVILAMPEAIEKVMDLEELREQVYKSSIKEDTLKPEEFNILKNRNAVLASQMKAIFQDNNTVNEIKIKDKDYYLTQSIIAETNWRLMILMDRDNVLEPVNKLDDLTLKTGWIVFGVMLLFYVLFLAYLMAKSKKVAEHIAAPIIEVANKTSRFASNVYGENFEKCDVEIEEIQIFTGNFFKMAKVLRELYTELENKVGQRTAELQAMYLSLQGVNKELEKEIVERMHSEALLEENGNELERAYLKLKDANTQILHQEKMASIGQLAAGVAHEINNPMGFVISNISLMKEYSEKLLSYLSILENALKTIGEEVDKTPQLCAVNEGLEAWMKRVNDAAQSLGIAFIKEDMEGIFEDTLEGTNRVKNIVQDLRTFSRSQGDQHMADINNGLESVINIIWNELKYKVDLVREYGVLPLTFCNIGQFNQVFMNILINAAQAIEEKGEIHIKTSVQNEAIFIQIKDTGPGMTEETLGKVFDPFYTTKEVGKGTGLGLSISYEIIKSYGGDIIVTSEVGKGTEFIITLPIKNKPEGK